MYDVELAQVTVAPLDDSIDFEPRDAAQRRPYVRDGSTWSSFAAMGSSGSSSSRRSAGTDFSSVRIGFDGNTPSVSSSSTAWIKSRASSSTIVVVNPEICRCRVRVRAAGRRGRDRRRRLTGLLPLRYPWLWAALGWLLVARSFRRQPGARRRVADVSISDKMHARGLLFPIDGLVRWALRT